MIKEIESYIEANYYQLLGIAKKYTKNDDWSSELLHEVIMQLYHKKEWKIKLDNNSIKSYIIRCLMVNWCYPSSPFCKKHKQDNKFVELNEAIEMAVEDTDTDIHIILDIIEIEWTELNWFNKIIFEKYLTLGSLKKVSKDTTIPLASIGRYVKETKDIIKKNTINKYENL
jgi:hypothetical protein